MALRGEAIAIDESIVLRKVEYARAGVSRLCVGVSMTLEIRTHTTHLWFWCDAPYLHPAESEVEEPWAAIERFFEKTVQRWLQFVPSIARPSLSKPAARPMGFDSL